MLMIGAIMSFADVSRHAETGFQSKTFQSLFSSFLERMLTDQGSFGITSYDTDFAKSSFRSGVENVQRSITLDKTSSQKDLISLVSC